MKSKEEIEQLAKEEYPSIIGTTQTGVAYDMNSREKEAYQKGYIRCQEDMASQLLDVDDINEMASDYIINTGGLPDSVESLQYCLHKFYEQINKQD